MMNALAGAAFTLGQWGDFPIVAKATLILALGLFTLRVAARASASVRHLVLAATLGSLSGLSVAQLLEPPMVTIEIPVGLAIEERATAASPAAGSARSAAPRSAGSGTDIGQNAGPDTRRSWTWQSAARGVWAAGVLALVSMLCAALWQLSRLRRTGVPWPQGEKLLRTLVPEAGVDRPVDLLFHDEILAPLTAGHRRPAILLPIDAQEWSDADLRRALVHELEHVRRCDWTAQLVARLVCALHWFNPLVWIAFRRFCLEAERACDDVVLEKARDTDYAEQLVQLAQRMSQLTTVPALAMASRSDLSARVSSILDSTQRRGRTGAALRVLAVVTPIMMVFAIAPLRAEIVSRSHVVDHPGQSAERPKPRRAGAFDRAIYEAADEGDVDAITKLLDAGADVNAAVPGDGSPLIGAARQGHLAAVRLLLDRGADPDLPVQGDGSPLIMAAREGHLAVVELLLDRGASIDQMVPDDENALIQASGHGELAVVELLVARGADVNAPTWVPRSNNEADGEWRSPLSMARKGGHEAVVRFLVSRGARE